MTRPLIGLVIAAACASQNANAADLTVNNVKIGTVLHGPPANRRRRLTARPWQSARG